MRKYAVLLVLLVAGIFTAVALSHEGTGMVSCQGATFSYDKFGAGSNTVNEAVAIDDQKVYDHSFTFNGSSATHLVPLVISGTHVVNARANWISSDGSGRLDSGDVSVSCSVATTTTPGAVLTTTVEHTTPAQTVTQTVTQTQTVVQTATTPPLHAMTTTSTKTIIKRKIIVRTRKLTPKQRCLRGGGVWLHHNCGFKGTG